MAYNRTYVILKPDCVERGLIGEVISRIERKGLGIPYMRRMVFPRAYIEAHYSEHIGKEFFERLVSSMVGAPVVEMIVDGEDAVFVMRSMAGPIVHAAPGTIRGDLATCAPLHNNIIHTSESEETALVELERSRRRDEI